MFFVFLDVYVFGVGSEIFDEDIVPLVTKRNDERHYFKVKNAIELEKTFDEIIGKSPNLNNNIEECVDFYESLHGYSVF